MNELIVVALGGNAFQSKGDKGSPEDYWRNAYRTAEFITRIVREGYRVVVTHGNGPQVGIIAEWMLSGMISRNLPVMPLDIAGAMSQGWLGYILQQSIYNKLVEEKLLGSVVKGVVTIITQTIVSREDSAFSDPTKYIGPWYSDEEARELVEKFNWVMKPDPRGGWRRVVPSPDPQGHVEINIVKKLVNENYIVITSGGGGIPVYIDENGSLHGVEAVIDKDLAGERLASAIGADILLILTDVDRVYLNYSKQNQKPLYKITVSEAKKYYSEGHFPPGSMGPKVLAAIRFIENGGKRAIIAHLHEAYSALKGNSGTHVILD